MRVIVKHPGLPPVSSEITGDAYAEIIGIVGGAFESCLRGTAEDGNVFAYCNEEGHVIGLQRNLIRPADGHEIVGPVVVAGVAHTPRPDLGSLTDRQARLWLALMALYAVDDADTWRSRTLAELVPRIDDRDRLLYNQLCVVVGR